MSRTRRRRQIHAETVAPWVALAFILLLWWMGAQALRWLRPGQQYPLWSIASTRPAEPKKIAKPIDAPAPAAAPKPGEHTISAAPAVSASDIADLRSRGLLIPVRGIPGSALVSSFHDSRDGRQHEAIDILAPRDTDVVAVEDGTVAKLFTSKAGGLTIYVFDPSGTFVYYYAHLDRYADNLREGDAVKRGEVIGHVGTTGNAPPGTPHLHFGISKLDGDRRWWGGVALDPYLVWQNAGSN